MVEIYQLDMFKDPEICRLEAEIEETRESLTRVRKGTYARINRLEKQLKELQEEHEIFKHNICRGKFE